MPIFTFKYTFNKRRCISDIEANSLYAAHIAFKKFIEERTIIESVEEQEEKKDDLKDSIPDALKNIFGMK